MHDAKTPSSAHEPPDNEEIYSLGYTPAVIQWMASRTATNHAAFLLPHLSPGMHVLDCGCGPGSITTGLAEVAAPGEAVGVDIEPGQIDLARARATKRGINNVRFEVGNIYQLPFPDNTFDAAFGYTILMQLREPVRALTEVSRVLKPGGVVGFCEPGFDGNLYAPPDAPWIRYWEVFARVVAHNGGNVRVGQHLGTLLYQAGFSRITMSASYECIGTPEIRRQACAFQARLCDEAAFMDQAITLGWLSREERAQISAAWRAAGEQPETFCAGAFCTGVGWQEESPVQ